MNDIEAWENVKYNLFFIILFITKGTNVTEVGHSPPHFATNELLPLHKKTYFSTGWIGAFQVNVGCLVR